MDNPNTGGAPMSSNGSPLSGKIMLCSVVVVFTVIVVMLCIHIYVRWHMLRRQHQRRRSRSRQLLHFSQDQAPASRRGLDRRVLDSIPIFVYSSGEAEVVEMECAVCLCEFQEKEKGRMLPGCKHSFHAECIDMWFFSHSTCPLCRSAVAMEELQSKEAGVGHLCELCGRDGELVDSSSSASSSSSSSFSPSSSTSSSSQNGSSGGSEIRIEVSARRVEEELKSPGGRMLSFKRILARESWFNRGDHGDSGGGSGGSEDVERGEVVEEER